ncbi:MAG: hypothetical protein BGO43_10065 [Gammaproteobacteria bacterium 39-13]|nr:hypothetical protein [Gammaproteobacteria bacterium]OJV89102.1 MAG: hypothetical protein BGO43_10065 [Gammaproteobacteria bacterium 39-13]
MPKSKRAAENAIEDLKNWAKRLGRKKTPGEKLQQGVRNLGTGVSDAANDFVHEADRHLPGLKKLIRQVEDIVTDPPKEEKTAKEVGRALDDLQHGVKDVLKSKELKQEARAVLTELRNVVESALQTLGNLFKNLFSFTSPSSKKAHDKKPPANKGPSPVLSKYRDVHTKTKERNDQRKVEVSHINQPPSSKKNKKT